MLLLLVLYILVYADVVDAFALGSVAVSALAVSVVAAGNVAVNAVAVDVGVMCMQMLRIFEGNHIYFICSYSIFFSISYIYRLNVLFINFVFENIFPCNLTND